MASESSAGFHRHHHHHQPQGMLFESGADGTMRTTSSVGGSGGCEMITMGSYRNPGGWVTLRGNDGPVGGIVFSSGVAQNSLESSSTASFLVDSGTGLKHDTGLAVEWSIDEQIKLEEGLARYVDEPNIMRYIKIAALLRNKTVRDVAMRCRWITRKRGKLEDMRFGKEEKDLKEKFKLSLKNDMSSSASSVNVAPYPSIVNHLDQSNCMLSGVLSGKARHLLEENYQAFDQISANLSTLKLQQNMDLFFRTRNNLTRILNDMSNMPGVMSQMPPLPVVLNMELATSILTCSSQPMHLKQETGC